MPDQLDGYPFWLLTFDADAKVNGEPDVSTLSAELKSSGVTDLFVFSHGWNNTPAEAMTLYRGFFGEVSKILQSPEHRTNAKIGFVGIIWPSIRWPDDDAPASTADSGAAFGAVTHAKKHLGTELKRVFVKPKAQSLVDELTALLDKRPNDYAALKTFKQKLHALVTTSGVPAVGIDSLESVGATIDDDHYQAVFNALAHTEPAQHSADSAGIGNPFTALWNGAKAALRMTTYWEMKNRGGFIGEHGLGPALSTIAKGNPAVRMHLIGHSFGARLVSYTLKGLAPGLDGASSPIKSLYLMQGAFSHFAFADRLEFDPTRSGDLKGMATRVDGPLVATHSLKDLAVGIAYPLASLVSRQDNAGTSDPAFRWEGIGHDGAQYVHAASAPLGKPGTTYAFQKGAWLNLDGNQVIVKGGPPSGAHGDIVHPETAWASLAAAAIVK